MDTHTSAHTLVKCRATLFIISMVAASNQSQPHFLGSKSISSFRNMHIKICNMKIRFRLDYSFGAPMTFCDSNNEKGKKMSNKHDRCRGGICTCRHCRRQCKIFASGVNFSIFIHFLCFFLLKLLKLGEIDGVKFLA